MTQRNTRQMAVTLNAVRALADHPTADRVYDYIHTSHPKVSRATVYRNLSKLCRMGSVRRVKIPGSADRFDHNLTPHYHFICSVCGNLEDLDLPYMENINRLCRNLGGRKVNRHTILFDGVCADCLGKDN